MTPQLPVLNSVLFLYNFSRSSSISLLFSSLTMSYLPNSSTVSTQSPVEGSGTYSNVSSNGEHSDAIPRMPARRRIASVDGIWKHLGYNKRCSLSENNKKTSVCHSKQLEPAFVIDTDHEKEPSLSSVSTNGSSSVTEEHQCRDGVMMHLEHNKDRSLSENKKKTSVCHSKQLEPDFVIDPNQEPCSPNGSLVIEQHQCSVSAPSDQLSGVRSMRYDDSSCTRMLEEFSLPTSFGKRAPSWSRKPKSTLDSLKHVDFHRKDFKNNRSCFNAEPFDICQSETEDSGILRDPLAMKLEAEKPKQKVLRPGMVLLKNYISDSEQVLIVRECRRLGLGPGGFYQPGFKGGAKLRLQMMCLGLDWDPQTRKYQKLRQIDRSKAPNIPCEFRLLVDRAMQDSHALIRRHFKVSNAEAILPQMSPNICIVNFYTETGRLGLHQDRDESAESLLKELPVVSFSMGDSAEFLYGDQRDPSTAQKVVLESGDVLIFGGQSRHVFHGVSSIIPKSAPGFLLEQTGLRPGRLNLTFRQY